jgi:hypothetical protein
MLKVMIRQEETWGCLQCQGSTLAKLGPSWQILAREDKVGDDVVAKITRRIQPGLKTLLGCCTVTALAHTDTRLQHRSPPVKGPKGLSHTSTIFSSHTPKHATGQYGAEAPHRYHHRLLQHQLHSWSRGRPSQQHARSTQPVQNAHTTKIQAACCHAAGWQPQTEQGTENWPQQTRLLQGQQRLLYPSAQPTATSHCKPSGSWPAHLSPQLRLAALQRQHETDQWCFTQPGPAEEPAATHPRAVTAASPT